MFIYNIHCHVINAVRSSERPPHMAVSVTFTNVGGKANHKHYVEYFPFIFSDIYILPGFCVGRALGCYLNKISAPLLSHHTVHVATDLIH